MYNITMLRHYVLICSDLCYQSYKSLLQADSCYVTARFVFPILCLFAPDHQNADTSLT